MSRLEEPLSEEGEHGRREDSLGDNSDIACRCVFIVERITGLTGEFLELAEWKEDALRTARQQPWER